jgi:hypothetical protein
MSTEWIGETTLVPSHLGPTPEFGPSGESPPLRTEPVVVSWALITSGPPLTEQALIEGLRREFPLGRLEDLEGRDSENPLAWLEFESPMRLRPGLESPLNENKFSEYFDTKRVVYRQYWQRDDPVLQLAPGENQTYSVQLTSGLTDQVLREFSSSLGLGGKISAVELSAQLSGRLSRTVTISTELQTTRTKQLTNTRKKYLQRVAVWHVVHSVSLYRVASAVPFASFSQESRMRFVWQQLQLIEFADKAAPQSTSFDVPTHRPV